MALFFTLYLQQRHIGQKVKKTNNPDDNIIIDWHTVIKKV
jgi:hypothetical protein